MTPVTGRVTSYAQIANRLCDVTSPVLLVAQDPGFSHRGGEFESLTGRRGLVAALVKALG